MNKLNHLNIDKEADSTINHAVQFVSRV